MRRTSRLLTAAAVLLTTAGVAAPATTAQASARRDPERLAQLLGLQTVRKQDAVEPVRKGVASANPLLSLTPDPSRTDLSAWRQKIAATSLARAAKAAKTEARRSTSRPSAPLAVRESEPATTRGRNDTVATAQRITTTGSAAQISGSLAPPPAATKFKAKAEDDGSIRLAGDVGLRAGAQRATEGAIGDGPYGAGTASSSGDFDFYALRGLKAGQRLRVDVDTAAESDLDSLLVLWDAAGKPVAANDDDPQGRDPMLNVVVPKDGDYSASVLGFGSLPADPFASGSGEGRGSEGAYRVIFGLDATDRDVYAVDLRAGDVLSASVDGAGTLLGVYDPTGQEVMGSSQDASAIYPMRSPLVGGGNAVVDHGVARTGRHYVSVEGDAGAYSLTGEVHRPSRFSTQTIFLDYDGARVNTAAFGGPGVRQLSPLSAFLTRWGIPASQEGAVADRITRTVTENLRDDLAGTGVRIRVLDSRHAEDPYGRGDVSRVVVGGTVAQVGVDTIGISQSIDPGNFETAETALVLLDYVSAPAAEQPKASFNAYLKPGSDRVAFVGTALGNIVSHEAGHFLGSWHVDQVDAVENLMDQGGNFPLLYGVGPDGAGGTKDDRDVDFGTDVLNPDEGFTGLENTAARTRFGLGALR